MIHYSRHGIIAKIPSSCCQGANDYVLILFWFAARVQDICD